MLLSVRRVFHPNKFSSKMKNHWSEPSSEASLRAFRSSLSVPNLESGPDFISLPWIRSCFDHLLDANKAFAKLAGEIDYPMSEWEAPSIEEYLSYTLRLLDLLNSVKSTLSRVSQARLAMSLSLNDISSSSGSSAIHGLRSIEFKNFETDLKLEEDFKERNFSGKGSVIHHALAEMKKNSDLAFGKILSSLSGDIEPYLKLKIPEEISEDLEGFIEKNVFLQEFKEINEAKARLLGAIEIGKIGEKGDEELKKLETKLEEMQKQLDDIRNKADDLFSEILSGRNEMIDVLRHRNH